MSRRSEAADFEVVVVGAGVLGASVADSLARRGHRVALVERNEPAGRDTPSGGRGRILRSAHGGDGLLARLAWRARSLWVQLEHDTGSELLVRSGVLTLVPPDERTWARETTTTLKALGVPVQWIEAEHVGLHFPSFGTAAGLEGAVYEPAGGVLRAAQAVRALVERARNAGAELVTGEACPTGPAQIGVGGTSLTARQIVWACGAALPATLPGLDRWEKRYQDVVHLRATARWQAECLPAWVDRVTPAYGHGSLANDGVKLVPDTDRADEKQGPEGAITAAREYAKLRFPDLADAEVQTRLICHYCVTPDGHFVVDRHPTQRGAFVVGGDSGHAFKHGPAIGEHVADLLEGSAKPFNRFQLDRPGLERNGQERPSGPIGSTER